MDTIELTNVTKQIQKKRVLSEINLSLEKGKIYGLYGRNGSGKTMLIRIIAGLILPTNGTINVFGKKIGIDISFPLGMKQKLAIAQAIMESPELIMLDEPTNSLDEDSIQNMRKILIEERERGAVVVIASHNKEDLKILADQVVMISEGRIIQERMVL